MAFRKIAAVNLNSVETSFDDPLIIIGKSNAVETDIGFLGKKTGNTYAGLVRDSETDKFILIDSITLGNAQVNDVSAVDLSLVKGYLEVGTISATNYVGLNVPSDISQLTDTTGLLGNSTIVGNLEMTGHIIPSIDSDGTTGYDLGAIDKKWRDLYLSQGSLYIDGQKVLQSDSGTIVVSADPSQSMTVKTTGTGVLTFSSEVTVNFAATLQMAAGKKITEATGTAVIFGDKIDMDANQIINVGNPTSAQHVATKDYVDDVISNFTTVASVSDLTDVNLTGLVDENVLKWDTATSKWIPGTASASIEGIKTNFVYTATEAQTAFVGADNNSSSLLLDDAVLTTVYMNGVRLLSGTDYTISTVTNTVTLATGATAGNVVEIEVFGNFSGQSGANVAITGGSITGVTFSGNGAGLTDIAYSSLTSTPTTLAGYGITDATDTNTTYTAGSGLSLTGTVFANTSPDQTVALTGGGATSISGTYPNFTITSTDTNTDTTYTNVSEFTNDSGYLTSVPPQTFSSLTGTPTTLAGYGITDAGAATVSTTAPSSPAAGDMWFDSTVGTNAMKVWSGGAWDQMSNKFSATGGTESTYSSDGVNYKVHTFTSSGTFTAGGSGSVDVLVIGGGASGGSGGGGGAGGYVYVVSQAVAATSYSIIIGGGASGSGGSFGSNGSNSVFSTITAIGGGGGGGDPGGGLSGGSGGGGGTIASGNSSGGSGTSGQGFAGGNQSGSLQAGGGGGGASGVGSGNSGTSAGQGGNPMTSSINGTSTARAGGGGGGCRSGVGTPASGGGGGAGNGTNTSGGTGGHAIINTGSGGGSGPGYPGYGTFGSGGSGVVIIRYAV